MPWLRQQWVLRVRFLSRSATLAVLASLVEDTASIVCGDFTLQTFLQPTSLLHVKWPNSLLAFLRGPSYLNASFLILSPFAFPLAIIPGLQNSKYYTVTAMPLCLQFSRARARAGPASARSHLQPCMHHESRTSGQMLDKRSQKAARVPAPAETTQVFPQQPKALTHWKT